MTVYELLSINQHVADLTVTVRIDGNRLLDELNIGPDAGVKPPYPLRVPKSRNYVDNFQVFDEKYHKDATYIDKSINARDDGRDYWQVKPQRVPKQWLELEVYSWEVRPSYRSLHTRTEGDYERLYITALPPGEHVTLEVPEDKPIKNEQIDGQLSLEDWDYEGVTDDD